MSNFFINRPIFAIVLSIFITIIGVTAAFNLPVAQYPQISPPTVSISTAYQGANAEVIDQTVAQIIEQQVNGVEGMSYMSSTSTDSGSYSLSVQFESGTDADTAAVQTQNRVSEATSSLPSDVQTVGVTTRKSSQDMSLIFTLWSPNDTYDGNFLKNYGSIYLLDQIKRVKGVGEVSEFGSDYSMRIWLQPEKMAKMGISISQVTDAIKKQNIQAPAGAIGQMPDDSQQEFQYSTRVKGRLTTPQEFGNIIVSSTGEGSFVHIKDIARVELGSKSYASDSTVNGHISTGFAVKLTSDANALETIGNVKTVLENASQTFPAGLQYTVVVDSTKFVSESMTEVIKTLAEAMLLVLVVVFLFLQSWRATLIPMLAIPVSLIGTFGAFIVLGFTINTLTLFAMVLAIGLVVDDAIVVIEAVEHHMRYSGLTPVEATRRAMSEVTGPVIAIAFVLASVFIPVAFFGGMMGILYKQFALTIAVSMALSAVVALSLTPALCILLLKPYDPNAHSGKVGKFFDQFNHWFETNIERYGNGLSKAISKANLCMIALVVLCLSIVGLSQIVPTSFVPDEDQGYFLTSISLPEAASSNRTKAATSELLGKVSSQSGVSDVMSITGFDLLGGGSKPNVATMFVSLDSWGERTSPELAVQAQIGQTFVAGAHLPEATVIAFAPPALPGLGIVGGLTLMLEDQKGGSLEALDSMSQAFVTAAKARPEIGSISSNFKADTPSYEFEVDREKAENMGVAIEDVFSALQVFLGGSQVNDFNEFGRTYKVIVQAETSYRKDINAARYLFVKSSSGAMVPLNTLIKPTSINAPATITRYNGLKAVKISATQASGYSSGQAMAALEEVAKTLPSGYSYEWSGQSREERLSGSQTLIVFGMAIAFAFLCLAALYESWSVPFAVLLTVPVGIFGAFLTQYARNLENSIYMQIALVMLIGLAAKNAILIVEFAKVRVDNGMDIVQASIEAAKIRLRPIIMTSLAFIIGCVPLAIATGAGAGARNSMGTAVVGGMFAATALGIFLIPVLFVVVEKIKLSGKSKGKSVDIQISKNVTR
ncbi:MULTISPECIES: efflux RND transporter permease subunit [Pelosinus]|uniref:Transporter, hydrophobe/amphiphile efflux-1 (HAE1) family n=1 Tax=Pelosinus fermentans B4 TaxID=1149862 RepID=I8RFF4_9FIRM|nr:MULTISPECIES: multidrug efflux RND transporter permease subunit [Pelosinus]EIW16385.1 transporter, hydrophobe/amphiphile efflux-1 (HAE1) family [Pelosinus fermentans B4]EIW22634.1 transporter, hydrophobe/amphiphile efflux-1 (HAE1) family [Pelosinus fermentans A11]OAM95692.1 transporter, hydrophobe/amphiphile efflux-1 (HAE1) family [Pelosinus fermentans DSM 17108]SDR31642.1 hydrophobe/amphiphile efflux-1 (HAE1) family protein [Pelosinus fermentans]